MEACDRLWGYLADDQWLAETTGPYTTSQDYLFSLAQGRPGCPRCTCMLVCILASANRTRDLGCSKHPVFPAPSEFRGGLEIIWQASGSSCRENAASYSVVVTRAGG